MKKKNIPMLLISGILVVCIIAFAACRRSGEVGRAAAEATPPWTLSISGPIDHLDMVAREPMIVEHPDGTLFVGGFGASYVGDKRTDQPTLWKSRDGGKSWSLVNVGTEAGGPGYGNSDMDLAVSPDGTLYFVSLLFNAEKWEGMQVSIGVSKDGGANWKWTLLSETRFDDRPWVEVAPDGTAHVIWNDGAGVCYAVSPDGGLTWTERDRIHPQGGSSHLAVGPNGEIAVRVTPASASYNKYEEGVDLIAVSTDGGTTWQKHAAPGTREWVRPANYEDSAPRWVEPLAWDDRGALYSFWTSLKETWLARSLDLGATWTTWRLAEGPEVAYFPYLVARGSGELAATWFSGRPEGLQAHAARIDVGEGEAPPRMVEAPPFKPDSWRTETRAEDPPVRTTAGEYLPILFLRDGGLAVVTPIINPYEKRFGFSLWKLEEGRSGPPKNAQVRDQAQSGAVRHETVYSESPAAFYEAMSGAARVSSDGRWALYPSYGRGTRLIDLETGREEDEQLTVEMDRVIGATFYRGNQLARRGERSSRQGWYLPGPDGPRLTPVPPDAVPRWSPDGSAVAYYIPTKVDEGLIIGDEASEKQYSMEGSITGLAWSPDGQHVYATVWHENGLTSLVRLDPNKAMIETLIKDLDTRPLSSPLSVSAEGSRLYAALASPAAPVAEARHQPEADRDLDIYELEIATGVRRVVVEAPGDDFAPCVANGFIYWTHNDIHDSVVVLPSSGGPARVVVDETTLPYWSPDGRQVAFTYGQWRLADTPLNQDAGVVAVDGQARPQSEMKPIVTGYHEDWTPAWSSDGKWIAYHSHRSKTPVPSYRAAGSTDDLYLCRALGGPGEEIRLTDFGWEVGPADWSPDGRRLVFSSWERGGPRGVSKPWIVTIDPANGRPLSAERLPLPDPIKNAGDVSWSPKGDAIAFEEHTGGNGRILWAISTDGKRAEKIVEYTASTYGGLDWMPDGKALVYGALAGGRMQIFAVPRSGGSPRQLTDDPASLMHPQVSPDGRWIACTRMSQSKEIRRLKL